MRSYTLPLLLLVALAAACGSDDATCDIEDNGDGTRTIACPGADPVRVVDGRVDATCVLDVVDERIKTIQCSDGTFVRIVDGFPDMPGSGVVAGVVQLFGEQDHSGVRITVEELDIEAVTDADGTFSLTLPAGVRHLHFEKEGWMSAVVRNVPVINGVWSVDPVVLRLARRVADPRDQVIVAPESDAVLVYHQQSTHVGGWLWLQELDEAGRAPRERLGSYVTSFEFNDTGELVLYNERTAIDGPLVIYDRTSREREIVTERALGGWFVEGGASVIYETRADVDAACTLHLWSRSAGRIGELASCAPFDDRPGALRDEAVVAARGTHFVYATAEHFYVARDLAGEVEVTLGPLEDLTYHFEFLESGPWLLVSITGDPLEGLVELRLVDLETGENRLLGRGDSTYGRQIAPGGRAIYFTDQRGSGEHPFEQVIHLVETGQSLVVDAVAGHPTASFSRDGERLFYVNDGVHFIELGTPENMRHFPFPVAKAAFAADGRIVLDHSDGILQIWDPIADTTEELEPMAGGWVINEAGTRVAARFPDGVFIADLVGGGRHRLAIHGSPWPLIWERDGDGLFFMIPKDDELTELLRWSGTGEPISVATSQSIGFPVAGPHGFTAFNVNTGSNELFVFRTDEMEVDAVDVPIFGARFERDVLLYTIEDPERIDRNGIYAFRLPRGDAP